MFEPSSNSSADILKLPEPTGDMRRASTPGITEPPLVVETAGRGPLRRAVLGGTLLLAAAYGIYEGYGYYSDGRFIQSTDDAYLKADFTSIAPKVSGYISEVLVEDNQRVKVGQAIAKIDDRDFQSALAQARSDLAASDAAIANIDAQVILQQSLINQAKAAVAASDANYEYALSDAMRSERLNANGSGSQSRAEQSQSLRDQARAAVDRDKAALVATENKVPVLLTQRDQAIAQRDRAETAVHQAELNLSYTTIVSAIDGTVGARTVRLGQLVSAGTQLLAVVPLDAVYVVANFKETQLTNVAPGQTVQIRVDSYPDARIVGHVDSISPGSGLEFSLLPADNATGNFTKIVQRIPVKIVLDDSKYLGQLRSGMSVVSSIDTRSEAYPAKVGAQALSGGR